MNTLLAEYKEIIESLELQQCGHGINGSKLTGRDWQCCCGISYEYLNDIGVRDAIQNAPLTKEEMTERNSLDNRLKILLIRNNVDVSGNLFWKNGLPFGVIE